MILQICEGVIAPIISPPQIKVLKVATTKIHSENYAKHVSVSVYVVLLMGQNIMNEQSSGIHVFGVVVRMRIGY